MRRGLFFKYVVLFVGLVSGVLAINATLDLYFVYQDNKRAAIDVQREKAEAAAQRLELFVREIERQIGWVAQAQWSSLPIETRRFDYIRLLRQVPAITELAQIDRRGREQLRVSRLNMDVVGSEANRSAEPAFIEAVANRVYFGPVYFRKDSEPYLTMAVSHGGRSGVTVADINLKLILEPISQIKVGRTGYAYVVDRQGRLVAHPDISLVLRGTDMSPLAQVADALKPTLGAASEIDARTRTGVRVLSAHAAIPALNWLVFVELPLAEAQQPVIDAGLRALALLVLGLLIAGLAAALLARRMVVPIRAMQEGAQRIGGGELGHRLSIRTGDELEALADQINRSAGALEESYATLEQRVEDRTAELRQTLEQQTATAGILQVISSSPTDAQPVFDAVAESAMRLLNGWSVLVWRYDGERMRLIASHGGLPGSDLAAVRVALGEPRPEDLLYPGNAILERTIVQIADVEAEGVSVGLRDIAHARGWRANIAVPMLREGAPIGVITVSRREPGAFTEREIKLLQTFADQAVIAVQNVQLFTELRDSLEQQTATADILQVISQSPTDVQPVLDAVAKAAVRFCGAPDALIALREGDEVRVTCHAGPLTYTQGLRRPIDRSNFHGRAILEGRTIQMVDAALLDPAEHADARALATEHKWRAIAATPMLREGTAVGTILLRKPEPGAFTPRQIQLLEAFAAQAVIAIENVRLFTELRDSLEQQTATSEILRVISQSPTDVQPVLKAVAAAARRFCGGEDVAITLREGDKYLLAGHEGPMRAEVGSRHALTRETAPGRAMVDGMTVHFSNIDTLDPVEYAAAHEVSRRTGFKSAVATPMLREGSAIGAIALRRSEPGPFTPRQIELLEAFAAQAVIAISNVRLFTEIQEKSRQLEVASQHKSQFLANMSHELRTPLNAILGYTEMMVDGLYGDLPQKATATLERVQSNGKHLLGLINDVLDLSKIEAGQLSLAIEDYSVADMVSTVMSATESLARTKNIGLVSAIPAGLPMGKGDARRLAQVLLNLVGNAIKFTDQGKVEIRAREQDGRFKISVIDTGPGIAPADQAKIFEEFQQVDNSSTRKKGGTGLGLSISRKIVELHGGHITVESALGKGSNFKVTIPIQAVASKDAQQ